MLFPIFLFELHLVIIYLLNVSYSTSASLLHVRYFADEAALFVANIIIMEMWGFNKMFDYKFELSLSDYETISDVFSCFTLQFGELQTWRTWNSSSSQKSIKLLTDGNA